MSYKWSIMYIHNGINDKNDKEKNKQRDRESGPAFKYFSISGFNYFLPLNNLVEVQGITECFLKHIYHSWAQFSYKIIQINIQPEFSRI